MSRPTYTAEQIEQFYDRINLPQNWRPSIDRANAFSHGDEALDFLTVLQRYHLANIPFENLELHYSRTKTVDIAPHVLFDKIVSQGTGRGGYCMENNASFGTVLRTFGFNFMSTGARVNSAASPNGDVGEQSMYFGFAHMVNIVTIKGVRYLVDVGFGAGCGTKPLPLEDGAIHLIIKPNQSARLRYDTINENESSAKVWIYERRVKVDGPFSPCYCFPDNLEFLPSDFMVMNHFTSTSRSVFFTYMVLAVKAVLSEDGAEIVGETVLIADKVHRRVYGKKEDLETLKSEEGRVQALERFLNIKLDDRQQSGIFGMVSMIN